MRARQALKPGRVKLTFEDGSVQYAVMTRADEPVVEGHPLNPYTLLKDETCTMLGGDPETMVPDDAFQMLAALAASGGGSGDAGGLEDVEMDAQRVTLNAGWTTVKFRRPLSGVPRVFIACAGENAAVSVTNITRTSCQIAARLGTLQECYVAASEGAAPSTKVTLLSYPAFSAITVDILAVYDGGITI